MVKIKIRNLSFAYRKSNVLKNLSFDINSGNLIAIIGPNGSGKSTLIKCIDNILPVKSGCIFIDDKDIIAMPANKKAMLMGYVPQQEQQVFASTVYETILMGRKPYIGWTPAKNDHAIVMQVIHNLHLENISAEYLNELSGGQKQRVLIGRALAQQPEVLLLDEPTANLDLKHQLEVMQILQKLTANGMTVILAVHDLNLAAKYCHHIIMLNQGELYASGNRDIFTPENIRNLYHVEVDILENQKIKYIFPIKPV